jgi:hypothetical protein
MMKSTVLLALSAAMLSACTPATSPLEALPASLSVGNNIPEDITANGSTAFVSSFSDGSVLKLDLDKGGAASSFVPASTDAYTAAWGLRVVPGKNWLLSIHNQPYDFMPKNAKAGRVSAYDLSSGKEVKSWDLPAQAVGNSVDVDAAGNIYVGDIGPIPRILKIDPVTGAVSIWATSPLWVKGGFGIGGMVYSGKGFYASHNNLLWYVAMNADGSAAAPVAVKIAGDPVIFADGMTWTDNGIVYAENDVLVAGSHGTVYKLVFTDPTTATRSVIRSDMTDPSGVTAATVGGKSYLLVNESQLGYAFGVDKGTATTPYQVKVIAR